MRMFVKIVMAVICCALLGTALNAEYVYNPEKLPADFVCDEEWSEDRCLEEKKWEAWHVEYGGKWSLWYEKLIFNTDIYFDDYDPEYDEDGIEYPIPIFETPNIVDAEYRIALRSFGYGWAFAINMVCPEKAEYVDRFKNCEPILRMVSFKKTESSASAVSEPAFPTTILETFAGLEKNLIWREAKLRQCAGATSHLISFPAQRKSKFWNRAYVNWLKGRAVKPIDFIAVEADGDGVFLRAKGWGNPAGPHVAKEEWFAIFDQSNRGRGYDWAIKMAKIVEPCLKPSRATPPWQKVIAAEKPTKP